MCNMTILDKIDVWPLYVTFDATVLIGNTHFFVEKFNEFRLFFFWSNFISDKIWQT